MIYVVMEFYVTLHRVTGVCDKAFYRIRRDSVKWFMILDIYTWLFSCWLLLIHIRIVRCCWWWCVDKRSPFAIDLFIPSKLGLILWQQYGGVIKKSSVVYSMPVSLANFCCIDMPYPNDIILKIIENSLTIFSLNADNDSTFFLSCCTLRNYKITLEIHLAY